MNKCKEGKAMGKGCGGGKPDVINKPKKGGKGRK